MEVYKPKIVWLINPHPQDNAGLNGATVEATLHINITEPVDPGPVELPTPTSTLQLSSDALHTQRTRTFVHGLPIYGSVVRRLLHLDCKVSGEEKERLIIRYHCT